MPRKPQRLIGAAVFVFWATMMALLVWREGNFGAPSAADLSRARFDEPTSLWMGIYAGEDDRIGTLSLRTLPDSRGEETGARIYLNTEITTNILGQRTELEIAGSAWVSTEHGVREFEATFRSGPHEVRLDGQTMDGRLRGRLHTGGESLPLDFPLSEALFSPSGGLPAMALPPMRPGDVIEMDAFDPVTLSPRKATVRCIAAEMRVIEGEPVETYVVETRIGLLTTKAWLSGTGEVLRAETPFGFTVERITEAEAHTGKGSDQELLGIFAVRASGVQPRQGARYMKVRVLGAAVDNVPDDTPYQRRSGREIVVEMPPEPTSTVTIDAYAMAEHLASDAFVTSDHPRILEAAREAVGDAEDAWEKARRLHDWVYEKIEKIPAMTVPTALDVLQTRHGDCNEHAVLYAAMARAVGVPTRIAVGLVWSDELAGFAYHAWVEVWCGDSWTPVDPTLGQPVADATHLKLLHGGIEEWTRLLPYFSNINLEVIEVR